MTPSAQHMAGRASLHEHLDGSLRVDTLIELSAAARLPLPEMEPIALANWVRRQVKGSLAQYLSCFALTTAVLQSEENLERVAYEHVEQLYEDGVLSGEVRFAPQLHDMPYATSIAAVAEGLRRGGAEYGLEIGLIACAMRDQDPAISTAVARAAVEIGLCCGFDLAGNEQGHDPQEHEAALQTALEAGVGITIHAGEAAGVESIAAALDAGASRIGHGVRLVEDTRIENGRVMLGKTAGRVRDAGVHLEVCISSNLDTAVFPGLEDHPVLDLHRLGLSVGLSTDNRLMSGTTMAHEEHLAGLLGATVEEIAQMRAAAHQARFVIANRS